MEQNEPLITFPCEFPIKIIGNNSPLFITEMKEVVLRHFPDFDTQSLILHLSTQEKYLALTIVVHATSQAILDAFYRELSTIPLVKVVL